MKVTKAHKAKINYHHKFDVEVDIPEGLPVTHQTACGYDERYNFLNDFSFLPEELSHLKHDLIYRGYNVPLEFIKES
ncbi:TPA: hypothetical protein ACOAY7_002927 [Vibrio cholerae]|nr:hypothetical protein 1992IndM4_0085 [Vibrio phage ICP1]QVV97418.1 hypothetical protein 2017DRC106_0080 [Vibrio phage ICP1]QVV97645.1 hypothetical protein 2017DRC32_0080 [Vibrio phage ICP1]QVV97872.1 hypothetical protein 2017DRC48_0080 [Vibrio phage ICP1]QVV98099.1 hypothetical protein 2017DRC55_0080 [Vibrio phage ICP1]